MQNDMWLRLLCAVAAGAALGLERESRGRAAGLRTTVLVCLAPCIGMMLSQWFYEGSFAGASASGWHPDPARLAAGILAGMGFLGGGVIIKHGDMVRGVTTASILWLASFLGLVFGAGLFLLGFAGLGLALLTVLGLPYLERRVYAEGSSQLTLVLSNPDVTAETIVPILDRHGTRIQQVDVEIDAVTGVKTLTLRLMYKKKDMVHLPERLAGELASLPGVLKISFG